MFAQSWKTRVVPSSRRTNGGMRKREIYIYRREGGVGKRFGFAEKREPNTESESVSVYFRSTHQDSAKWDWDCLLVLRRQCVQGKNIVHMQFYAHVDYDVYFL